MRSEKPCYQLLGYIVMMCGTSRAIDATVGKVLASRMVNTAVNIGLSAIGLAYRSSL